MRGSEIDLSKKKGQRRVVAQPSPAASNQWLAYATLPLRFFLGVTFIYAGLQKVADAGFLQPGSSTYIGTQLQAYAATSPIGFFVQAFGLATPQLTGIVVIAAELAIGILVTAGDAPPPAAAPGALVNFPFFLSPPWGGPPDFLGPDRTHTAPWRDLAPPRGE